MKDERGYFKEKKKGGTVGGGSQTRQYETQRHEPQPVLKVAVRQRTEIYNPADHTTLVYERGHVFDKPWEELLTQAKADTKNRILALIEVRADLKSAPTDPEKPTLHPAGKSGQIINNLRRK